MSAASIHHTRGLPFDSLDVIWVLKGIRWRITTTLLRYECFELLNARLFRLNASLRLLYDPIVGFQLFLQLNYGLVPLVQPLSQRYHDVSLLQEELLVAINLGLPLLDLRPLFFDFVKLGFILLSNALLLLDESGSELRSVLDLLTSWQNLGVHSLDLVFKLALLFLGLQEFVRPYLQRVDGCVFVGFGLLFLSLELLDIRVGHSHYRLRLGLQLLFKLL